MLWIWTHFTRGKLRKNVENDKKRQNWTNYIENGRVQNRDFHVYLRKLYWCPKFSACKMGDPRRVHDALKGSGGAAQVMVTQNVVDGIIF